MPSLLRKLFSKKYLAFWIIFGLSAPGIIIFGIFHKPILAWLQWFSIYIKDLGFSGMLLVMLMLFVTGFPPMFGYSTLLTLCGFVYRMPLGLFPAYFGALSGALACFVTSRRFFKQRAKEMIVKQYPHLLKAVEAVVDRGGLKLLVMIRLAPSPYAVMNLLFSTTNISFRTYATATAIALLKNSIHVALGSSLQSLTAEKQSPQEIFLIVLGIVFGAVVFIYTTLAVKKALNEISAEDEIDGELQDLQELVTETPKPQKRNSFDVANSSNAWNLWDFNDDEAL